MALESLESELRLSSKLKDKMHVSFVYTNILLELMKYAHTLLEIDQSVETLFKH